MFIIYKKLKYIGGTTMKSYLKCEFKRTVLSINTLIAFIITLLLLFFTFLDRINFPQWSISDSKHMSDGIYLFLMSREGYLCVLAPLLAAIVFSDAYLLDKESGFLKHLYLKISRKRYIFVKILVNGAVSGLILVLASSIMLGILVSIFGVKDMHQLYTIDSMMFNGIYFKSRFLYAIFLILMSFVFNITFATLALGISPWIKNRYLTFLAPFLFYILSGTILPKWMMGVNLFLLEGTLNKWQLIAYELALLVLGVVLFYVGVMFKDEENI